MNPEIELLYNIWDSVKPYVSIKERLHVAEEIVRVFDDQLDISEVEDNLNQFDSVMKAALISQYEFGFDDDDEDWD
jgi:translation initiation factor RLI1